MKNLSQRNYGIDLLRLLAMYLIVLCHCMNQGGVVASASGAKLTVLTFIRNNLSLYGTNCFALISGYVGYRETEKKYRYFNFIKFWLPVVFYSLGIALFFYFKNPGTISKTTLLTYCLPISFKRYWYMTAYAGVFFIIPWLNRLLRVSTKTEAQRLALLILMVFVIYPYIYRENGDIFVINTGYSFLWLSILYLLGACMKKCGLAAPEYRKKWLWVLLGSLLFNCAVQGIRTYLGKPVTVNRNELPMVLISLALVGVFAAMKIGRHGQALIRFSAPAALGVYLIHVHPILFEYLHNAFAWTVKLPVWLMLPALFGSAFLLFAACLLVEKLRILLFQVLRVDANLDKLEKRFETPDMV